MRYQDGTRILTVSEDVTVRAFTTDIEELLKNVEERIFRQLTDEEKERYGTLN